MSFVTFRKGKYAYWGRTGFNDVRNVSDDERVASALIEFVKYATEMSEVKIDFVDERGGAQIHIARPVGLDALHRFRDHLDELTITLRERMEDAEIEEEEEEEEAVEQ